MSSSHHEYILGSDNSELARLGYQHRMFAQETYQSWIDANFRFGQHLLDLGCGPGFASQELAQMVGPHGKITAIDSSEKSINFLKKQISLSGSNIDIQLGDLSTINLGKNIYEGAFSRMVMVFLSDPQQVIEKIYQSLRPGAHFVSIDFAGYFPNFSLGPNGVVFSKVVHAISKSFEQQGLDLHIQKRMPELMSKVGLQIKKITPIQKVARPGEHLWDWAPTLFANFIPKLIHLGLLTEDDEQDFWKEWAIHTNDYSSSYYLSPLMLSVIGQKT